jgi:tetratricopeptide (TPR) repeat protein
MMPGKILLAAFLILSLNSIAQDPCEVNKQELSRAKTLMEGGSGRMALFPLNKYIASCNTNPEAFMMRGSIYLDNYALDSALSDFRRLVSLLPNDAKGYRKIAGVYFFQNHYDSSMHYIDLAMKIDPDNSIDLFNKGEIYYYRNDPGPAEIHYRLAYGLDSNDITPLLRLCDIYTSIGDIESCEKLIPVIERKNADPFDVLLTKANIAIYKKEYEQALKMLNEAWILDSTELSISFSRAKIFEESGYPEDALKEYNIIIQAEPENGEAYLGRGLVLYELEQDELAFTDFKDALELDSLLTDAWFHIGLIYYDNQLYDLSIGAFNSFLAINPEDSDALFNRGNSYYALQQHKEAMEDYNKAIRFQASADMYYNRALCHYALANYTDALRDLDIYIQVNSSDAEAYYIRCLTNQKAGRKEEACADCSMALFLGYTDIPKDLMKACKLKKKK